MAKGKSTVFFCKECGYESAKWMGQCPACREWNTPRPNLLQNFCCTLDCNPLGPVAKNSAGPGSASAR